MPTPMASPAAPMSPALSLENQLLAEFRKPAATSMAPAPIPGMGHTTFDAPQPPAPRPRNVRPPLNHAEPRSRSTRTPNPLVARSAHMAAAQRGGRRGVGVHPHGGITGGVGAGVTAGMAVSARQQELERKVQELQQIVDDWHQVLKEVTQAVVPVVATAIADMVPYYSELPESESDLASPVGRISVGRKAMLIYPQFERASLLFMRMRMIDPHTGEVQQFYVPVGNEAFDDAELAEATRIDTAHQQFFSGFHLPGETDPGVGELEDNTSVEDEGDAYEYDEEEDVADADFDE